MAKKSADDQFREDMMDFKDQMLKFVDVANHKFDGLTSDVRTNTFKLERLENGQKQLENGQKQLEHGQKQLEHGQKQLTEKLDRVASDLKALSGQFADVAGMVIRDHHPRIDRLEERVSVLESEAH